jgi:phytoene dehydrogenase-like protein
MTENRKTRHVVVIGAGIAGLSAASYLLRNGYRVTIVEQHTQCGGLCTSWKRGDYTIDYCVHWLMGTDEGSDFHSMWQELGAFTNADGSTVPIVNFDDFTTIVLSTGETVVLHSDIGKLRSELLGIGPEDAQEIDRLCTSLERLGRMNVSAGGQEQSLFKKAGNLLGMLASLGTMMRHLMPIETYAKRFKSPRLRELLLSEIPGDWGLITFTMGLSQQPKKQAGYTVGGSLNIARNIERVVIELGGTLKYGCEVTRILVANGQATGVQLADGSLIEADHVISAADGYATLHRMLGGAFMPETLKTAYETYPLFPSTVFVALGVDRDCSDLPHAISPWFTDPITLPDGTSHNRFGVNVYRYDPTLAPQGKTLITVLMNTWEAAQWEQLYQEDRRRYEEEKKRIGQEVIKRLDALFGGFSGHVEMIDISTPQSVICYTRNWRGSIEGFAPTKNTLGKKLPKVLPGLEHFSMIGQWTSPGGGLPTAAKDGRDIAKRLCKEDKRRFTASRVFTRP